MNRLIIKITLLLFFFPLGIHAQKEDFRPPQLIQKRLQKQKVQPKRKSEKKVIPVPVKNQEDKIPIHKPVKKTYQPHNTPRDTMPTPGFIRYIPRSTEESSGM